MLRKLILSAAFVSILGAAYAFAPASATDVVAASSDAVPVANPVLSHSVDFGTRG